MNKRTLSAYLSARAAANLSKSLFASSNARLFAKATVALLCLCVSAVSSAAGDAASGKANSAVCAGCHGADGKAITPEYPNLAGQHASYIAKQLTAYRDGARVAQLMSPMAAALSDQDILDLAAYYSQMTPIEGVSGEENLTLGQNIYRGGVTSAGIAACIGCHGPTGNGNPAAAYPSLSGQNVAYLAAQLKLFRSGERNNDPNEMMRALAHRLSDAEIDALANYATGLH